jgi:hypothetical protein
MASLDFREGRYNIIFRFGGNRFTFFSAHLAFSFFGFCCRCKRALSGNCTATAVSCSILNFLATRSLELTKITIDVSSAPHELRQCQST